MWRGKLYSAREEERARVTPHFSMTPNCAKILVPRHRLSRVVQSRPVWGRTIKQATNAPIALQPLTSFVSNAKEEGSFNGFRASRPLWRDGGDRTDNTPVERLHLIKLRDCQEVDLPVCDDRSGCVGDRVGSSPNVLTRVSKASQYSGL